MSIDGHTQLVGLVGWPVSHSLSPVMHNAAFKDLNLNWQYVPLPVPPDAVADAVRGLAALGLCGANVTVPHKQTVMRFLDEIDPGAQAIGAVNTIVVHRPAAPESGSTRLVGHNTDWTGFLADLLARGVGVAGRDCLVLGAGGAARAIVYGLAKGGGKVDILARRRVQADRLLTEIGAALPEVTLRSGALASLDKAIDRMSSPLIVNSTPLGMHPNESASIWPRELPFPNGAFIYDLVYNPPFTRLMRRAQEEGHPSANGLGMLVHQGAKAFELWTGYWPDVEKMKRSIGANES